MLLTNKGDKIIACFVKFLTAYVYKTPSLLLFPAYDGVISLATAIPLETIENIVFVHIFDFFLSKTSSHSFNLQRDYYSVYMKSPQGYSYNR